MGPTDLLAFVVHLFLLYKVLCFICGSDDGGVEVTLVLGEFLLYFISSALFTDLFSCERLFVTSYLLHFLQTFFFLGEYG